MKQLDPIPRPKMRTVEVDDLHAFCSALAPDQFVFRLDVGATPGAWVATVLPVPDRASPYGRPLAPQLSIRSTNEK